MEKNEKKEKEKFSWFLCVWYQDCPEEADLLGRKPCESCNRRGDCGFCKHAKERPVCKHCKFNNLQQLQT